MLVCAATGCVCRGKVAFAPGSGRLSLHLTDAYPFCRKSPNGPRTTAVRRRTRTRLEWGILSRSKAVLSLYKIPNVGSRSDRVGNCRMKQKCQSAPIRQVASDAERDLHHSSRLPADPFADDVGCGADVCRTCIPHDWFVDWD